MAHEQPILDHQTHRRRPKRPWWRMLFVWELICFNMWGMSLLGPVFVALGVASFVFPIDGLTMNGRPVRTSFHKVLWTCQGAVFAIGGVMFVMWHVRQMRRERRTTPLCPGCRNYVTPVDGQCPDCGERLAEVELTESDKRQSRRGVIIFAVTMVLTLVLALILPLFERTRPQYGQRFRTVIRAVDLDDGAALKPSISTSSGPGSVEYQVMVSGLAGALQLDWRYPGRPLTVNVSAEGYETVPMELSPESPATMTVPLKRKLP